MTDGAVAVLCGGVGAARFLRGLVDGRRPDRGRPPSSTWPTTPCCTACTSAPTSTPSSTRWPTPSTPTGAGVWPARPGRPWTEFGRYGNPTWFNLGDRDLATHIVRTERLPSGATLSEVTAQLAAAWELALPRSSPSPTIRSARWSPCDGGRDRLPGVLRRPAARRRGRAVRFDGRRRRPARAGRARRDRATPTPWSSRRRTPSCRSARCSPCPASARPSRAAATHTVAISPIVAGAALKGPADRMLARTRATRRRWSASPGSTRRWRPRSSSTRPTPPRPPPSRPRACAAS